MEGIEGENVNQFSELKTPRKRYYSGKEKKKYCEKNDSFFLWNRVKGSLKRGGSRKPSLVRGALAPFCSARRERMLPGLTRQKGRGN